MPKYEDSKIYAIRSYKTDRVYIGSTTQTLNKRFIQHKHDALKMSSCKSKELFQYGDAYIELIENYPCKTIEELHKRESDIMKITPNLINKFMPGVRTIDPDKKEKDNERHKILREKRKHAKRFGITLPVPKRGRPVKIRNNEEISKFNNEIIKLRNEKDAEIIKLQNEKDAEIIKLRNEKDAEINLLKYKLVKMRRELIKLMKY
jgi:hypothetical protein